MEQIEEDCARWRSKPRDIGRLREVEELRKMEG